MFSGGPYDLLYLIIKFDGLEQLLLLSDCLFIFLQHMGFSNAATLGVSHDYPAVFMSFIVFVLYFVTYIQIVCVMFA